MTPTISSTSVTLAVTGQAVNLAWAEYGGLGQNPTWSTYTSWTGNVAGTYPGQMANDQATFAPGGQRQQLR